MTHRGVYQIRVQGQVSKRWAHWFEEMTIQTNQGTDADATSELIGPVADQAALLGLLQKLYTLGMPLLSVRRIEPGDAEGEDEMLRLPPSRAAQRDR